MCAWGGGGGIPQILITEHLISFANFLEFLICLGIIWIFVRVQLPCQHIICLLDLRTRRIWGNSESLQRIHMDTAEP